MKNLRGALNVSFIFLLLVMNQVRVLGQADGEAGSSPSCSPADRAALLGFKASILRDTTGILSSWTGTDCCGAWEGISCHPTTGRVISLQLQRPQSGGGDALFMKGILSPSLGGLQFLEVMVIGGMKQIRGTIPESFSRLSKLTQLYLEDNLLEGTIPESLGRLTSLKALSLSGNHLEGQLPASLASIKGLLQINVGRNLLAGPIPPSFKSLLGLQSLDLSHNNFSWGIPSFLGQFQNLTYLDLSNNQFSGGIPMSLCSLSNALDISLSHNRLTGEIPSQVSRLKSLTTLSLSDNLLTGSIPESIASLQKLWYLNVSTNGLLDPLPNGLANGLPSLLSIDLSYNRLNLGSVPDWLRKREMREIHLAGCNISGTITIFIKPGFLNSIDLSNNYVTGDIAYFLTNMTSLQRLKLSNNQLYGAVSNLFKKASMYLEFMDISNNKVTGTLPEFSEGWSLKWLDLSRNAITGQIPSSISQLSSLERLDFSRNQLKGNIPESMGQMVRLEWLDLSINGFTGKIPESFLHLVNIRHASFRANRLCGQIPQGRPYNIFPVTAYAHNQCLCGQPLSPCRRKS